MFKRFAFLVMLMAIALSAASGAPTASGQNTSWPANDWPTSTPEAQGMHSGELAAFFETWSQPHFNFDSMVVVRHGTIVAEAYGPLTQPERSGSWRRAARASPAPGRCCCRRGC